MEKQTRITRAKTSVRRSRYAIGIGAALAFFGLGFAARAAHPGAATALRQQTSSTASQDSGSQQSSDSFFFDDGSGGSVSPSQSSSPSVQSSGS